MLKTILIGMNMILHPICNKPLLNNLDDNPQDIERALKDINLYRISGALPEESDSQLQEDLRILQKSISYTALPSISPTFEVIEESGNVEVHIVSTIADSLKLS